MRTLCAALLMIIAMSATAQAQTEAETWIRWNTEYDRHTEESLVQATLQGEYQMKSANMTQADRDAFNDHMAKVTHALYAEAGWPPIAGMPGAGSWKMLELAETLLLQDPPNVGTANAALNTAKLQNNNAEYHNGKASEILDDYP